MWPELLPPIQIYLWDSFWEIEPRNGIEKHFFAPELFWNWKDVAKPNIWLRFHLDCADMELRFKK